MLIPLVFTLNPRRSSTLTSSFLRLREESSPVLLLSETSTEFMLLEMLICSLSSFITPRNTFRRRSDHLMTNLCDLCSTEDLDHLLRTSNMLLELALLK